MQDNIQPGELAQYGKLLYWASSTGRIFSRIDQFRTLAWQLLRFTRKYTMSRRIYSFIIFNNPLLDDCPRTKDPNGNLLMHILGTFKETSGKTNRNRNEVPLLISAAAGRLAARPIGWCLGAV